jgi:hypothetical protein
MSEKLIQVDPANMSFGVNIDTDGLQDLLRCSRIRSEVPIDVRKQFEVARKLFVYGYFVYDFYTQACLVSILAVEAALIRRFTDYYGADFHLSKKSHQITAKSYQDVRRLLRKGWRLDDEQNFRGGLKSLLGWAAKKNLIGNADAYTEDLPRIRGEFAHPLFQSVLPMGMAQLVVTNSIELANDLFRTSKSKRRR